jgi:hypothetical protein
MIGLNWNEKRECLPCKRPACGTRDADDGRAARAGLGQHLHDLDTSAASRNYDDNRIGGNVANCSISAASPLHPACTPDGPLDKTTDPHRAPHANCCRFPSDRHDGRHGLRPLPPLMGAGLLRIDSRSFAVARLAGEGCHARSASWVVASISTRIRSRFFSRKFLPRLFGRGCDDDVPVSHVSVFAALKVDGSRQFFVTVERTAGDARDLLVFDNGSPILHNGDGSSYQRDIEALPHSRLARHLRRWGQETPYTPPVW